MAQTTQQTSSPFKTPPTSPQHLPLTNATASTSLHLNHSLINNPNNSETRCREIDVTSAYNYRKLDAATGTRDGGTGLNDKKKKVEQKPKTKERRFVVFFL
ncbi:hypothetical protein RJT34_33385 [Clitoria ternatea]|uniref:Uncharacterized protein n=1 Tax=Clitoria ternatea TaxID=43366 RepID=A0AAN9I4K7_CLITE